MRAIIIDDKDARSLLQHLELTALREKHHWPEDRDVVDKVHRTFHYVVCRWLQDQGATVT